MCRKIKNRHSFDFFDLQNNLMVNGICGRCLGFTPLIVKKSLKINGKCNQYDFYKSYQSPLGQILNHFSKLYQLLGLATSPLLEGWYIRDPWFARFFENITAIINISLWIFLVARSYLVVVINIKISIMNALVTLETSLNVSILAGFFYNVWLFSSCFFFRHNEKKWKNQKSETIII